jgi:hypothetical protein
LAITLQGVKNIFWIPAVVFHGVPEASGLRHALAVLRRDAITSSTAKKGAAGCSSQFNKKFK